MATHGDPEYARRRNLEQSVDDDDSPDDDGRPPRRGASLRGPVALTLLGALLGSLFAGLSTRDFMQHLDRQVHAIHCSFLPGAAKDIAESGCRTVMMSPYSSFFRESLWGGIPISLLALAVFAFLAYRSAFIVWRGQASRAETRFLLVATVLPVLMSIVFAGISLVMLDATCKVCIGIYAASALCFLGAAVAHRRQGPTEAEAYEASRFPAGITEGLIFVAALTAAYVVLVPKPNPETSLVGCSWLVQPEDTAEVMVPLPSGRRGGTPSIEVLDPLCPSCKAFDTRLSASSLRDKLDLKAVLFPLDSQCNWMVTEAVHPGACAVSEAVLCAAGFVPGSRNAAAAQRILAWAFENQADLRALAAKDGAALRRKIEQQFPEVIGCLGGPVVKNKLTKGLRWAVANAIPVLTPQLFVAESRMCDEDTDLGLEYTLSRMLSPQATEERARRRATLPPPPRPSVPLEPIAAVRDPGSTGMETSKPQPGREERADQPGIEAPAAVNTADGQLAEGTSVAQDEKPADAPSAAPATQEQQR
jgi:uncharacterized membrane protein